MLLNNTKQVNRIVSRCLAWCTLLLVALMATTWLGFFHFNDIIKGTIIGVGFFVCVVPSILYKLEVSESFLKYYMLIAVSLFIGLLGTNNGIGIYISYVLVPIVSGLYLDRRFTLRIGIISYVTMTCGVFVNCAGKMEVIYKGWSHMITFRDYMIGFTLEYIVVMVFLYQLVRRAQSFLEAQQESLKTLRKENRRQREMFSYVEQDMSEKKKTAIDRLSREAENFTQEDYNRLATGHQFNAKLIESMKLYENPREAVEYALETIGGFFELDRILYIEMTDKAEEESLSFQWARKEEDYLTDFVTNMPVSDKEIIAEIYDREGYIEEYKGLFTGAEEEGLGNNDFVKYMASKILGAQMWLPTLSEGRYDGAICMDRYNLDSYTPVEKLLLAEVVSSISMYVNTMNSERANEAKSTFLSNMSHEIRTPMNAILGMTTVALRKDMNDEVRKSLNIIRSSSQGLLSLINDILDLSKIESGRIDIINENYHSSSLFNDVITMANARNAEKGLAVTFSVPEEFPTELSGDTVRLKQVMINLATNAIKYTDEGSVDIAVSFGWDDSDNILMEYRVSDTGQGIKEEDLGKLFQSYSQVNQSKNHHKEGTGLGLAISKQLAELMGGTIDVESTYGKGSTFTFKVPQLVVNALPAGPIEEYDYSASSKEDVTSFTAKDAKVLIVDDNELNLMVAEALFEPFELQITTAFSGDEALRKLEEESFDLIFLDHFMPGMDGDEVARKIRAMKDNPNNKTPIVALTADAVRGVKEKMLESGMNDFLSKPIDMNMATKILKKYLG